MVGDGGLMMRGISGGERKRLTTAEMVVGPQRVLLMDEISTGLDSATLFSVIAFFTSVRCAGAAPAHPTMEFYPWTCLQQHQTLSEYVAIVKQQQMWLTYYAHLLTFQCCGCCLADVARAEPDDHHQLAAAAA
jgi:ABC-type Mn2+/Zn2+ transport system ATPase subunit